MMNRGCVIKSLARCLLISAVVISAAAGQSQPAGERQIEEIIVKFEVPKLIERDITVQYDGAVIFLPLVEIFELLEINTRSDFEKGSFGGDFIGAGNKFDIDLSRLRAECAGKMVHLDSNDFILSPTDLFLRIDLYQEVFGLKAFFNFSELGVYMPLNKDFPAYQKLKRKAAHAKLMEEEIASKDIFDIPHERENLKGGMADWVLTVNPLQRNGQYFGLGIGGMLLGGDVSVNGSYSSGTGFNSDQLRYRWHYVFNDNKYISQIELGEINADGPLMRRLDGVMITNKPQIQRKYFQTITVSGHAGAGWEVELYVNNRLTEFAYTNENGDYDFLVDINYGSSRIVVKLYGPNGEVETREEFVRTPFNLIPKNNLEYTIAGGMKSTRYEKKKYAQASAYYGIFNNLTLGVSSDFPISPVDGEKPSMAAEATYQPFGSLFVSSSYSPDYQMVHNLNFNNPSIININGSYSRFFTNPFWNQLKQASNISISLSSPLKIGQVYLGPRFRFTLDKYPSYKIINMNYGLKLPISKVHLSYFGNYKISDYLTRTEKRITSQIFASTSFFRWFRPQFKIDYEHSINRISKIGVYLQKRVFKTGQLSFSFERNTTPGINLFMLSFNIYNSFANFTSRANVNDNQVIITQTQKGSIRFDQEAGAFRFERRNGLGLGAAVIWPFLDENYNGVLDEGEPLLPELRANIGGASGMRSGKNKIYYYDGLRPYDDYIVQIDPYSLDNPLLRPAHENFRVSIAPNTVTSITVPVVTAGEINGLVEREIIEGKSGVGGIKVKILNEITGKEVEILTFNSGEYYFLGLVPGMYKAYLNRDQIEKSGYISEPSSISFQIKTVEGGDRIENLNFVIKPKM